MTHRDRGRHAGATVGERSRRLQIEVSLRNITPVDSPKAAPMVVTPQSLFYPQRYRADTTTVSRNCGAPPEFCAGMTLTGFVTKSAFRNKRRSILTVLSISFSLLLLTVMMTVWRSFYVDKSSAQSAQRLITRHKVSLTQSLPIFYRDKMRSVPGVVAVAPTQWFGGLYKDEKPENFFAQFGTDPQTIFTVMTDFKIPPDQLEAWQHDQAGAVVDSELAKKFGWKVGDRIVLKGTIFPMDLELTIRGIFTAPQPTITLYFNWKYVEEAIPFAKGRAGTFNILADSPDDVPKVASAIDAMFRNSPEPTKTESEKAFQLDFINSIGNVKAFILSICFAVVFATLLVSATPWRCRFASAREKLRCSKRSASLVRPFCASTSAKQCSSL